MDKTTDWFEYWFDTKYYHVLYDHRDDEEAEFFMKNLILFLQLEKGDRILDLPCGKGRHSVFLNSQGFDVVGADLSKNSIDFAKRFENRTLQFRVHDMRHAISKKYKAIFNLFTSFGYFDEESSNIDVLKNFKNAIESDGHVIIDFLNIEKIKNNLKKEEVFEKGGILFHIKRCIQGEFLIKTISFEADNKDHNYMEKVHCLTLDKAKEFAMEAKLNIKSIFGGYNLVPFDKENSDRLILILQ
jgi:cyclopropane fatty-acyl-phospholipid synthase-like methyltransferase